MEESFRESENSAHDHACRGNRVAVGAVELRQQLGKRTHARNARHRADRDDHRVQGEKKSCRNG